MMNWVINFLNLSHEILSLSYTRIALPYLTLFVQLEHERMNHEFLIYVNPEGVVKADTFYIVNKQSGGGCYNAIHIQQ